MLTFSTADFVSIIHYIASHLRNQSSYLCQLDGEVGDGDHGTTMTHGFDAVVKSVGDIENREADIGRLLEISASAFLDEVGATMGPLYATALLKASALFNGQKEIPLRDIVLLLPAVCGGIADRGNAKIGDKTMMDVWIPVSHTIKSRYEQNLPIDKILVDIGSLAQHAADTTKTMVALKGRAARLGERSLGHIDPGAASAAMIIEVFSQSVLTMVHDVKK